MVEDETLEQTGTLKDPPIPEILRELHQASSDCSVYNDRVSNIKRWWFDEWPGQSWDGCKRAPEGATPEQRANIFPWDGCSDSRLRIVNTIIVEHVTLALTAFWSAKVQAKSIRPFIEGRETNVTQHMLDWRVYSHMKRELLRELPLAFSWKYGAGLSFIGVTWEQQRELIYVPITIQDIGQLTQQLGLPDVMDKLLDPDKMYDDDLAKVMQQLSPVLPTGDARGILNDLRNTGKSELPITALRLNKPKWIAKRPLLDVMFPSETSDIQQARWVNEPELVSESELIDRIETDGYDADFVEEALQHKGEFSAWMTNIGFQIYIDQGQNSNRDMVQLHHFVYQAIHHGVPCKYKLIFNEATLGKYKDLFAVHRKFEYDHQQYPLVALRRGHVYRPLLSSVGIAEESYTDEWDIKRQQDGLNNRTDLIHAPPMVVPTLRAKAVQSSYGPRSVMTAPRPEQIVWQPLPPIDQTPIQVMMMVEDRLNRRYGIIGGNVDPEIKSLRRQHLANDVLGEMELVVEQTLQLMQQYETDADVQKVAGGGQPWQYTVKDIQGMYEISATVDMHLIDKEAAAQKLDMLAKMLPFKEQGMVFQMAAQIVDPDLADALSENQSSPAAMEKERNDEYSAVSQIIGSHVEPVKTMMAMNQLRLQTIQQILTQPQVMQRLSQDEVAQKLIQNRVEFFQNQIQQFEQNPQIGRALSTQTFAPSQAPVTSQTQPQ
jgi:hypothetical protein